MRISLIVAASENRVIGRGGTLPWRLPADLRRFRRLTMGHHLVMGRKTYESIGRVLPGRTSIVLTRQNGYSAPGTLIAADLNSALRAAAGDAEVFVIGGEAVFTEALRLADRIYFTQVHAVVAGDAYFPPLDEPCWTLVEEQHQPADAENEYELTFRTLERRSHETDV